MKDSLIPEQDKEDKGEAHKAEFVSWLKISSKYMKIGSHEICGLIFNGSQPTTTPNT